MDYIVSAAKQYTEVMGGGGTHVNEITFEQPHLVNGLIAAVNVLTAIISSATNDSLKILLASRNVLSIHEHFNETFLIYHDRMYSQLLALYIAINDAMNKNNRLVDLLRLPWGRFAAMFEQMEKRKQAWVCRRLKHETSAHCHLLLSHGHLSFLRADSVEERASASLSSEKDASAAGTAAAAAPDSMYSLPSMILCTSVMDADNTTATAAAKKVLVLSIVIGDRNYCFFFRSSSVH